VFKSEALCRLLKICRLAPSSLCNRPLPLKACLLDFTLETLDLSKLTIEVQLEITESLKTFRQ
jgi:hypothetical protein